MNKKILARKENKILVYQDVKYEIGGSLFIRPHYVVWLNEDKMNQDIGSEVVNGQYRVYCKFVVFEGIDFDVIRAFLNKF